MRTDGGWFQVVCEVCGESQGWANRNGGWDRKDPCPRGHAHRLCAPCRGDEAVPLPVCPLSDEAAVARAVMA